MKQFILIITMIAATLNAGQAQSSKSISQLLSDINRAFDTYNKYDAEFRLTSDNKLIFHNEFDDSRPLDFNDIGFRIDVPHKSVYVYCLDGTKCIYKGGDWDEYNVSLVDASGNMVNEAYTVLDWCNQLKTMIVGGGSVSGDVAGLLDYINGIFKAYNTYDSRFSVNVGSKTLTFSNNMSTAEPLSFYDIDFRIDEARKSIDIYCLDGSKCMSKGGSNWDYYNVSLIDNDLMYSEIYTVLNKCKELKRLVTGGSGNSYSAAGSIAQSLVDYINTQFNTYNKYEASFALSGNKLIFSNKFGPSEPLDFNSIDFKINTSTKSIDVYCLDGTKCINKGGSEWNSYNVSLTDASGNMVTEAYTVLGKCKELKKACLSAGGASSYSGSGNADAYHKNKDKIEGKLRELNGVFNNHSQHKNTWTMDYGSLTLIGKNSGCEVRIPLKNLRSVDYYERDAGDYRYGFKFVADSDAIVEDCPGSYSDNVTTSYEYLNIAGAAEEAIELYLTIKDLAIN